jgi:uncharacterized protein (DUF1330 family)
MPWRALSDQGRQPSIPGSAALETGAVVIIEFPDMDRLNAWYHSAEYQPLFALRKQSTSDMDMIITLEGV